MNDKIREAIGIAIGEASMCWSEVPTGVFESSRARDICDRLCLLIESQMSLEAKIEFHINELRPLLDEWSKSPTPETKKDE